MSNPSTDADLPAWRQRLLVLVEAPWFQRTIIVLIVVNAAILGLETSPAAMAKAGRWLIAIDHLILAVFVVELSLRFAARGLPMLRDPWSIFDIIVVGIALVPASDTFSVLRALRVLRVLRIASAVPRMRRVVSALLESLPGLGAVVSILLLIFYVAAVMATNVFGEAFPAWFGTLPRSLYSLFQIMTLESWSMGIVRPVMAEYPYAWLFFVPFILIATFTMLNLFIAVVVNAMQSGYHEAEAATAEAAHNERLEMLEEVKQLRQDVTTLSEFVRRERGEPEPER